MKKKRDDFNDFILAIDQSEESLPIGMDNNGIANRIDRITTANENSKTKSFLAEFLTFNHFEYFSYHLQIFNRIEMIEEIK